jgi:ABC-type sulfate transport system substrate-binding protein
MVAKALTQLERFLDPVSNFLTPEIAQAWLDFRYDSTTQTRLAELAERANEGLLTDEEREEYAQYVEVGDLIGILQARARGVLKHRNP